MVVIDRDSLRARLEVTIAIRQRSTRALARFLPLIPRTNCGSTCELQQQEGVLSGRSHAVYAADRPRPDGTGGAANERQARGAHSASHVLFAPGDEDLGETGRSPKERSMARTTYLAVRQGFEF